MPQTLPLFGQFPHTVRGFISGPADQPSHQSIHEAIGSWVSQSPHAIAAEHEGQVLTYGELDQKASELAGRLSASGVQPGDSVGLFLERSLEMLIGILATLKTGAAYVPQDARIAPKALLSHVARMAGIRAILTLSGFQENLGEIDPDIPVMALDELPEPSGARVFRPARPAAGDDPCYILFTSGTTGLPNGVAVTHHNLCNLLLTKPGDLGISPGTRVGQILNIGFDMAAWEILGCLANGGTLLIRGSDIAATAERADVVIATPSVLAALDPDACTAQAVAVAGEPCPRPLADLWARTRHFYNGCGPTETTIVNTMQFHHPHAPKLTIGRPTPNNTVYVLDEAGRPCGVDEIGEMWAGGDGVSAGYVGNQDLTDERYLPDPYLGNGRMMFRTRDLGSWTAEGELEHHGRTDDQVKVRGFRVELDSVSAALASVPGCLQATTVQLDDRHLASFVTPESVSPDHARATVAGTLPYYAVPRVIVPMKQLPLTDRGKTDKAALLHLARTAASSHEGRAA